MNSTLEQAIDSFSEKFLSFQLETMTGEADRLLAAGITMEGFVQACMPCMAVVGRTMRWRRWMSRPIWKWRTTGGCWSYPS